MAVAVILLSVVFPFLLWKLISRPRSPSPLKSVAGPEKEHWFKGNYHRIFQDGLKYNLQLVRKYGGVIKIHALLGKEQLYVSDPLALHYIVVKEQHIYTETDMFIAGNKLIFGEGLISTLGEQHRKQRKMLNPVFSLANMRELLPVIQPIAFKMRSVLLSQLPTDGNSQEVDVLPWMSRGTLEYISQAGLGYTFNALEPTRSHSFTEAIKSLAPAALKLLLLRPFVPLAVRNLSVYWRNKLVDWSPVQPLRDLRRIVEIMDKSSRKIFFEKKAELENPTTETIDNEAIKSEGNLGDRMKGKDIMTILLKANASSDSTERLTEAELLGQMNTVIFAGFETSTIAISRLLYILASERTVQARIRNELRRAKLDYAASRDIPLDGSWNDIELPYDVLMSLPYLDAVVRETLRVYPPTSLLSRTARETTTLPLQYPILSATTGEKVNSVVVPEGTTVIISILAANHNKTVWGEDASEWRPERWLSDSGERVRLNQDREQLDGTFGDGAEGSAGATPGNRGGVKYPGVYASMMTFLGGGRACIGFKFAEMEIKQIITTLISSMHFSLPSLRDEMVIRKRYTGR
ncbi:cytochrome P450 [Multifurca ochricompacta]|uniref:Cytochrome P450 n=1 Tax=Multifurca ochricompacta TaxID=376703 RepID=A0AAD4QK49_9AGAM|nr:cytochrome P450 [Multifurca ochricompacta]